MGPLIIRFLGNLVLLLAFWLTGCQRDNMLKSIVVNGPAPTAAFTYAVDSTNPLKVVFTNNSKNLESVYWKFGDGVTSTVKSPEHVYSNSGSYQVELVTRSAAGYSTDTIMQLIIKGAKPNVDFRYNAMNGRSAVIDPSYPYYKNRSVESIADEIALAGYKSVHYMVVNELEVDANLVKALHDRGLAVWLLVFANGTYSAWGFPSEYTSWEMEVLNANSSAAGFINFSPFSNDYVSWKKQQLASLVATIPFDGVELFESFFPGFAFNGIENTVYGDIGPNAQQAFQEKYGSAIPNFTDPADPNYYKTNQDLYDKWVQFRIDGISDMLREIFDGAGGIRQAKPGILVGAWGLGVDWGGGVALEKEYEAQDIGAVVNAIHPDIYFLETNWPDWIKTDLKPDYITTYQPFVDAIKQADPNIPIGIQTDYGSHENTIRSSQWMQDFDSVSTTLGYTTSMGYEFHIGGDTYYTPPAPLAAKRQSDGSVIISFNKRIDEQTASQIGNYSFKVNGANQTINIINIAVDGNRVILQATDFPPGPFEIDVNNIKDTPSLWLFNDLPANTVLPNSSVAVE